MANLVFNIVDGHLTIGVDIELSPEQQELVNAQIENYLSNLEVVVEEAPACPYSEDCKVYDGHLFKVYKYGAALTWSEAKAACEARGGHLATSTSAEKNEFLSNLAGGSVFWLGGTYEASVGVWRWVNGEAWSYTNWNTGQELHLAASPYVNLAMRGGAGVGIWFDVPDGHITDGYICECDYEPSITVKPKDYSPSGLPPTTTPDWTKLALPATYSAYENSGNMYYGRATLDHKPYEDNLLIAPLIKSGNTQTVYPMYTSDLLNWRRYETVTTASYGGTFAQCFFADWNKPTTNKKGYKMSYLMFNPNTVKKIFRRPSGSACTAYSTSGATSISAGCYSPQLRRLIFVSEHGEVSRVYDKSVKNTTVSIIKLQDKTLPHCGLTAVNPGCAVWIPNAQVFCVAGKDGVSVSETSDAGSWVVCADAPKDLRGLTYRDDIEYQGQAGCVFAWSGEDKLFYKSRDGRNWERHNPVPIPLDEVKSVAYSPEFGMYCAVGKPENGYNYAYLSKDLLSWGKSKVSGSPLTAESVVWMSSTKKFVLLPNSGTYCYVFDPVNFG